MKFKLAQVVHFLFFFKSLFYVRKFDAGTVSDWRRYSSATVKQLPLSAATTAATAAGRYLLLLLLLTEMACFAWRP